MNEQPQPMMSDAGKLAERAEELMSATAGVAGEKISEARKRLAAALDGAREIASRVGAKAVESAKAADEAVHKNPYPAIAIGVGAGVLIGYLLARRNSRDDR